MILITETAVMKSEARDLQGVFHPIEIYEDVIAFSDRCLQMPVHRWIYVHVKLCKFYIQL